jgi:hypothetical protein
MVSPSMHLLLTLLPAVCHTRAQVPGARVAFAQLQVRGAPPEHFALVLFPSTMLRQLRRVQ